ncbi:MAG: ROK family protein [Armatimonadota bacterium]
MPDDRLAIGIDVGGTALKSGVVSDSGDVLKNAETPSPAEEGREAMLAALKEVAQRWLEDPDVEMERVQGIGVDTPGCVDETGTVVSEVVRIPGWRGTPIARIMADEFGLPAAADNDVNAMCYAEWRFGAARGRKHVACITLGAGVGGALLMDGKVHRGASSFAGEIGHMVIAKDGPQCGCGRRGCFETYVGARPIAERAQWAIRLGADTEILAHAGGVMDNVTPEAVFSAAKKGDRVALSIVDDVAQSIAVAMGSIMNVLDPDTIVIGGGIARAGDILFDAVRRHLQLECLPRVPPPNVVPALLGNDAGMIGSAILALDAPQT